MKRIGRIRTGGVPVRDPGLAAGEDDGKSEQREGKTRNRADEDDGVRKIFGHFFQAFILRWAEKRAVF